MMISAKKTPEKSRYPLHYLVWHNKHRQLEKELLASEQVRGTAGPWEGRVRHDRAGFLLPIKHAGGAVRVEIVRRRL